MIQVLDSSEIIAFYIKTKWREQEDSIKINYESIRLIAREMENKMPDIRTTSDLISIDAFRCEFHDYVEMTPECIEIREIRKIANKLKRFQPSQDLCDRMMEVPFFKDNE